MRAWLLNTAGKTEDWKNVLILLLLLLSPVVTRDKGTITQTELG